MSATNETVSIFPAEPISHGVQVVDAMVASGEDVELKVTEKLSLMGGYAQNVRDNYEENRGNLNQAEVGDDSSIVLGSVAEFVKAYQDGLITPPADPLTRDFLNHFVTGLSARLDRVTASYAQPLIESILKNGNFVQLSPGDDLVTDFERLLIFLNSGQKNQAVKLLIIDALLSSRINVDVVRKKIAKSDELKLKYINDNRPGEIKQEDLFILQLLEGDPGAQETTEFYNSLKSTDALDEYYKGLVTKRESELRKEISGLTDKAYLDMAAKQTTRKMQEHLMHLVFKIYGTVLAQEHDPFDKAVQEKSGSSLFYNANTFFNSLNIKILQLASKTSVYSKYDEHGHGDIPYYQVGVEQKEYLEFEVDPITGEKTDRMKIIKKTIPTDNLQKVHFKTFIENMHLTADSMKAWIEFSHNANYIHITGGDPSKSVIEQKAGFAHHMDSYMIDQLYRLPFGNLVDAIRMNLNAYLRREMCFANWERTPDLMVKLFEHKSTIEEEILHDLIASFRKDKKVAEWMIEPAIIFARAHMSMISLQLESIAGYGEPPIDALNQPSFKDPFLKRLEIYRTGYNAGQWGSSDATKKGAEFLPIANRSRMFDDWFVDIVEDEGRDIYKTELRRKGKMAYVSRHNFDMDTPLQITEINPYGYGGVEQQRGWRFRDAYSDWLIDMVDHLHGNERALKLKRQDGRDFEIGWKRLENLGVNVLKSYVDEYVLKSVDGLKLKDGKVTHEKQYQQLFRYLYDRYLKEGVGKEGVEFVVQDEKNQDVVVRMADIDSADLFWEKVISKMLYKPTLAAPGEKPEITAGREQKQKHEMLKKVMDSVYTVVGFEHCPTDFIYIENPSYSQNGSTMISVLFDKFIQTPRSQDQKRNEEETERFKSGLKDIEFVQLKVKSETADEILRLSEHQHENGVVDRNIWAMDASSLTSSDNSEIRDGKGYVVDSDSIALILKKKYIPDWDERRPRPLTVAEENLIREKVDFALAIYDEVVRNVVKQPKVLDYELNPKLSATRIKNDMKMAGYSDSDIEDSFTKEQFTKKREEELKLEYAKVKEQFTKKREEELKLEYAKVREGPNKQITSRLMWSGQEILNGNASGNACFIFDDTIYPGLRMGNASYDTVYRTIMAVHNTQGAYKAFMDDSGKDGFVSVVSKYYREQEKEGMHTGAGAVRKSFKEESDADGDLVAARIMERMIMMLRIDSRIDSQPLKIANQKLLKKPLSVMSKIVKDSGGVLGEYAMSTDDRFYFIKEAMHKSLTPKNPKSDVDKEYDLLRTREEAWGHDWGAIGEMLGSVADNWFGPFYGKLVRNKCKEATGEGMRDREVASLMRMIMNEHGRKVPLLLIVTLIMFIIKGYKGAEEAQK